MSSSVSGNQQPKSSASSQRPPVPAPKQQSAAPVSKPAQSMAGKPNNDSDDEIQWVGDVVKVQKNAEPKRNAAKVVTYTAAPATRITVTNQTPDGQPKVIVEEGHIVTEIAADDLPAGNSSSQQAAPKAQSSDELRLKSRKPDAKVEALSPKKSEAAELKRDEENVRKEMGKLQIKMKHEEGKPSSSSESSGDGLPFCQPSTSKAKDEEMDTDREKVKIEDHSRTKTPENSTSEDETEDGTMEEEEDSDDDENRDMYYIPPENLERLSEDDRGRLMHWIEVSRELDKRIANINQFEDALQDTDYEKEYTTLTTASERLLNKIIRLAGFEDNDQENDVDVINGGAMKPFSFHGSGHTTLDKCITVLVRRLLEQDPLADRVRINERGFEDGALAKLGPRKIALLITELTKRGDDTCLRHEVTQRRIAVEDVYPKVRDTIKKYRAKLFNKTVIPKFAGSFDRIKRPDDTDDELDEKLRKGEREAGMELRLDAFADIFEKKAKKLGLPVERAENGDDVVEPDVGDTDDDDEEDDGNDTESIATTSSMNDLVDKNLNTPVVARSSKRQSGSESEPENDTPGSKRAKSGTPDATVNFAVAEEDPTEYPEYIMEMLGGD